VTFRGKHLMTRFARRTVLVLTIPFLTLFCRVSDAHTASQITAFIEVLNLEKALDIDLQSLGIDFQTVSNLFEVEGMFEEIVRHDTVLPRFFDDGPNSKEIANWLEARGFVFRDTDYRDPDIANWLRDGLDEDTVERYFENGTAIYLKSDEYRELTLIHRALGTWLRAVRSASGKKIGDDIISAIDLWMAASDWFLHLDVPVEAHNEKDGPYGVSHIRSNMFAAQQVAGIVLLDNIEKNLGETSHPIERTLVLSHQHASNIYQIDQALEQLPASEETRIRDHLKERIPHMFSLYDQRKQHRRYRDSKMGK